MGYVVWVAFNGNPESIYLATTEPAATILAPVGTSLSVRVVPFDNQARTGPSSPTSDVVLLVDATAPTQGGTPSTGGDPTNGGDPTSGDTKSGDTSSGNTKSGDPPPPEEIPFARFDLDGNGRTDLGIRDAETGWFRVSSMDGSWVIGPLQSVPVAASLQLVGAPDLDADGRADPLWQDPDSGAIEVMLSSAGGELQPIDAPATVRVVGSADYTGDGRSEIVVTDDVEQELDMWIMDGAQRISTVRISAWRGTRESLASADVDGDGLFELVTWNRVFDWILVWNLDGGSLQSKLAIDANQMPEDWVVVGAGDVDADGVEELFWRDPLTRQLYLWRLVGGTTGSLEPVTIPDSGNPEPVMVGDFDADGRVELLTQDDGRVLRLWFFDGTAVVDQSALMRLVSPWNAELVGAENPGLW